MPQRRQIERAARRAGFIIDIGPDSVFIGCPNGYAFSDQTYGEKYSEWPTGKNEEYTKAYAYECCAEIIAAGMTKL